MRALLVNPWIYDFAAYDLWSKPLGLLRIATHLKRIGYEIRLIDCLDRLHPALLSSGLRLPSSTEYGSGQYYAEEIEKPALFKDLPRKFKRYGLPRSLFESILAKEPIPDIILVTTGMTYWYPAYIDIIKLLKGRFPSTPLVLGGNYPNICYEHAKATSGADHVYRGNDIVEIGRLVQKLAGAGSDPGSNPGSDPQTIDSGYIPSAYDLYPHLEYATLKTSSGCPFKCTYCGWHLIDGAFAQEDAPAVAEEIERLYKDRAIRNFAFYDDALIYKPDGHIANILETLIRKKVRASFHTPNGLHNRFMTGDIAKLFKAAGFVKPRLALETSSARRQAETGAKTTNEEFLHAVGYLKKAGYDTREIACYILIGLPGQAVQEIRESVEFAVSHGVRIFLEEYSPIPGTPDYKKSGLADGADPLLHNNSAFPIYNIQGYNMLRKLKTWTHDLNKRAS